MAAEGRVGMAPTRPDRPVLIYNADCAFCRTWVARAKRLDSARVVEVLPLADRRAESVSGRTRAELEQAVHLVRTDGVVFAGAAATRELCRYLRWGWLARGVLAVPGAMTLAARAYAWIARRWGPLV